ncbi:hypothetical protein Taro_006457 [Colocasia esculenta]|uniref:Uncharacterized protein n=1 Tax=Colocasia esculenta TaxID=4460 RepID=A0A843TW28_COLES|nr:hypothetical protein [Colocasia esculenta]
MEAGRHAALVRWPQGREEAEAALGRRRRWVRLGERGSREARLGAGAWNAAGARLQAAGQGKTAATEGLGLRGDRGSGAFTAAPSRRSFADGKKHQRLQDSQIIK